MSGNVTRKMVPAYFQKTPMTLFFAGMFQSPEENFFNTKEIEFDVERDDEDLAIVIRDLSQGGNSNSADIYTNKSFVPPIYDEKMALNAWDLLERMAGNNPFADYTFRGNLITRVLKGMQKLAKKIGRSVELQASQVMQTGKLDLRDSDGKLRFEIDFAPKATHFPYVTTAWSNLSGSDPTADIDAVAQVNRDDGKADSNQLIFGKTAWDNFLKNEKVIASLDNRRVNVGEVVRTEMRGQGGKYHGNIDIGEYTYEMWTYSGRYKHPETGTITQYLDPTKVVIKPKEIRLDAFFGAIPNINRELGIGQNLLPELPGRFSSTEYGVDLSPTVWTTNNGRQMFTEVGARPLYVPTAIDQYGCLNTIVAP